MDADWEAMALVGRIARPHGIRGQLIVNPETDFPTERFAPGAVMFVRRGAVVEPVTIDSVRFHLERPVISLHGVEDMNTALTFVGTDLRVPADQLLPLPVGAFYHHQLAGCSVVTRDGRSIGAVRSVEGTMAVSRLVVDTPAGDVLVPLVLDICVSIDPAARRIVIDPPEGLLTVNAPDPRGTRTERREAGRRRVTEGRRARRTDGT